MVYEKPAVLLSVAGLIVWTSTAWTAPGSATRPIQVDGPPPGHTGGFGEPTCAECHTGLPLNEPGGTLEVVGIGGRFEPGATYPVTIRLRSFDMGAAGFQAALRWTEGSGRGTSAGALSASEPGTTIVENEAGDIHYAQHTAEGIGIEGDLASWSFDWTAPAEGGSVALHVAANSGNGDNSPLDDLIYTLEATIEPEGGR
ncbi:MAG: hypothetical protein MJB57_02515 [Gemmatimonadetes bacterium]|nr:hypothetical protein [Gemmatimonadota bacterium]